MTTLTEFLLARITEDEERARRWQAAMDADEVNPRSAGVPSWVVMAGGLVLPARVLAECEAKRRIVAIHGDVDADPLPWCAGCGQAILGSVTPVACDTLRALALPYADHPDYRQMWKP